jgi:hypothetical protein
MSIREYITGAVKVDTKNDHQMPVLPEEHSVGWKSIIIKMEAVCSPETSVAIYQARRCHNQKITILTFTALKTSNPYVPVLFQRAWVPFKSLLHIIGNSSALLFCRSREGKEGRGEDFRQKVESRNNNNSKLKRFSAPTDLSCYITSLHKSKFGLHVPTALTINSIILWDVTCSSLVNVYLQEVSLLLASS